jgi:nucleoside-diphosphate-sugar epimerase
MPPLFGLARRHRLVVAAILIVTALFVFTRSEQPRTAPVSYDRTPGVGLNDWDDAPLEEDDVLAPSRSGLKGWFQFSGLKSRGRTILITGGAGTLAHALAPRLIDEGFIVHALDIAPKPATLPAGVVYHRGNVASTFRSVLESGDFDGVVHFAAVSLEQWCAPKEDECTRVNVDGTKAVVDAIEDRFNAARKPGKGLFGLSSGSKVPWILFGSSMDVFGPNAKETVHEGSPQEAESAIGRTKATAEAVVRDGFERARQASLGITRGEDGKEKRDDKAPAPKTKALLHAAVVRFADIYGYRRASSIPSAFFPRLIQNAVTSLPVQFSSDRPPMDLLHVEDAVDGVLRIVQLCDGIARLGNKAEPSLLTVNLVHGGKRWAEQEIVDVIRSETQSFSPVRDIGDHKVNVRGAVEFSNKIAKETLGWEPKISLPVGLAKSVMHLAQDASQYAQQFLIDHCPKDPIVKELGVDGPLRMLPEDSRNTELWKLNKCTVNMAFDNGNGFLHHMKCEDGKTCNANGKKVPSYNWNATVWIIEEVPGEAHASNGRITARLWQENGMGYLGIPEKELELGETHFEMYTKDDKTPHLDVFEIDVAHDSSFLSLSIPKQHMQVWTKATADEDQSAFELIPEQEPPAYNMRLSVLCCPSEGDWPLLLDDHESADSRFGFTNQIPSNSSRRTHLCERAHDAHTYYEEMAERSKKAAKATSSDLPTGKPLPLAPLPDAWALKKLPPCWNDCASPTVCMQTGKCRCVQADSCPRRRENPLTAIARGPKVPITPNNSPLGKFKGYDSVLKDMVPKVDWRDLLYPEARAYLAAHPEFIKVHVVDGYPRQQEIESADCHNLQSSHCFSADSIMYKAMRHLAVPADQADLIVLPVFQHCTGADFILHDVWHHASTTIKSIDDYSKPTSLVMTHDWGICLAFDWEIWSSRPHTRMYPDPLLRNTIVFSVMGDWDSNCYRPAQDVVVPARTCLSKKLVDTFPNVDHIMPARERPRLITWSGTFWGTGKNERLRLTCHRGGVADEELLPGQGPQSKFPRAWDDYMVELNTARFCPQPRGVAGWSPRVNDALYAGCIPVLIAEASHYPFASMIDWSQISVRIHPTELDQVERILNEIPLERVQQLQANIVAIRDAFLYATDERPQDELERRGPMFFALHEAGMRLRTQYAKA